MQTPEGEALVARYYLEAPEIAARLTQIEDLEYAWSAIARCVSLIEQEKYEQAIHQYHAMFRTLSNRVLSASA